MKEEMVKVNIRRGVELMYFFVTCLLNFVIFITTGYKGFLLLSAIAIFMILAEIFYSIEYGEELRNSKHKRGKK